MRSALTRPEHLANAEITAAEAEIALDVLAGVAEPVESHFLRQPRLREADDHMVFEAVANGRVDAIATLNARDFAVASEFGIAVPSAAEIVKAIVVAKIGL